MPQTELGHHLTGIGKHRARLVRTAPQQLQHGQAPQGRGLQRWRRRRHALHPNHIQASPARLGCRARSPQRGVRGGAQRGGDLAVIPAAPGRDQGFEQVDLGITHPSEPGPGVRPDPMRLGQPGGIPASRELVDGLLEPIVGLRQPARIGVDDELAPVADRPRRQRFSRDALQVVDQRRPRGHVTRGQERLTSHQQQLGMQCGIRGGERGAPRRLGARGHQFVTVERAARRRQVASRGSQGEFGAVRITQPEIRSIALRCFQVAGDHLVGFERQVGAAGLHPVRQPLVQIGPLGLQQPAVGDVADQHVVEPPHRRVTGVGSAGLREVEPAQPIEHSNDFGVPQTR